MQAGRPPQSGERGSRVSLRSGFIAFRNRNFRWHWFSTLTSFSGMQMQGVALGILGWDLTHSYAIVGALQAAFALPMALLALPGGAAVDRLEKRRVVAITQLVLGALAVLIAVLVQVQLISVLLLFASGIVQGAMFSVNGPARMSLLTEVVEPEEIPAAISMQNIAMNSTRIVAPALAGLLIAFVSVEGSYYVSAALYLFTVFAILQVPATTTHIGRKESALLRDVVAGLRYVFGSRMLRSLLLSGLMVALFIMPYQVMLPGFAESIGHPGLFGPMIAISGAGGLLGSLVAAPIANHPRKPYLQFLIGLAAGASLIALGVLSGPFGAVGAFIALALVGATATSYMTLNQTMLMMEADSAYRGRVISLSMLTFSAMPLMSLPLGLLADVVGSRISFVTQGVIAAGAVLVLALANRAHTFQAGRSPAAAPATPPTEPSPAGPRDLD